MRKLFLAIAVVGVALPVPASALTQSELKNCEIPNFFRFRSESAELVAFSEVDNARYLYVALKGQYAPFPGGRKGLIPLLYKKKELSCELLYADRSGHNDPLSNVAPESASIDIYVQLFKAEAENRGETEYRRFIKENKKNMHLNSDQVKALRKLGYL